MSKDQEYNVIGTRPIRPDGADKVTGRAIYGGDVQLTGTAYGKILRSPHAHARIKSIDTSAAEALPGVFAVATGADWPDLKDKIATLGEGPVNLSHLSANLLARDKVLYKGHSVAAVAAVNVHVAEEALALIKVDYEVLPSTICMLEAMKEDAPLLHDDLFVDEKPSNIGAHMRFEKGDIEAGFASCDVVIEREFRTSTVHQGYIEPHAATAHWNQDGTVKIWASTQGSFTNRQQTAELLQIPLSKVTVVPCEIGGGFGGKIPVYIEPVCAILSRKAGRPVKISLQRDECFEATGPTPGSFIRLKLGATKDGKLVAGEAWLAYDNGAYPGGMIACGCMCVFSCYDLEHAAVDGYEVCANKPKIQPYRAPGATQAALACETVVDEIAEELGICPLEFRINNAAKEGTRRVDGPVYPKIGFVETLEAARESDHWKSSLEGPNRGRSIAAGYWFNIGLRSSVTANVNGDGTITLIVGSTDIGGSRASLAMQLAETVGVSLDDVIPQVADTDSVGYNDVTGGSRVTFATGLACYQAGINIQTKMTAFAAELWECEADDVVVKKGVYSNGDNSLAFKELAVKVHESGEPITSSASIAANTCTHGFAVHICDVEVDPETGKTTILRYTAVQDVGKAIHPSYVEGQLQGGAVQGIGWTLNEEYFYNDDHHMVNSSFLDYRMPTTLDVPMIETILVEIANPEHPFGVRGVGEPPIIPPPPAITCAIYKATGHRVYELPISPPKLWKALSEK